MNLSRQQQYLLADCVQQALSEVKRQNEMERRLFRREGFPPEAMAPSDSLDMEAILWAGVHPGTREALMSEDLWEFAQNAVAAVMVLSDFHADLELSERELCDWSEGGSTVLN